MTTSKTFDDIHLIEPILKALKAQGYTTPTPIQEQSIPIILQKRDLLGRAQTGTGKTAASVILILQLSYLQIKEPQLVPHHFRAFILTRT